MPCVDDLTGILKKSTDVQAIPRRIRYLESDVIKSGQYWRIKFPKVHDDLLDCRSINLNFTYHQTYNGADAPASKVALDAHTFASLFHRIRVLSGSTVLVDIVDHALIANFLTDVEINADTNAMSKHLIGNDTSSSNRSAYNNKHVVVKIGPPHTLLNGPHLIPLSRCSDLIFECYMAKPDDILALETANGSDKADYFLTQVYIDCRYLRSASLSQYYNQNGLKFSVVDITNRYESIQTQEALIRFSSSHSSLDKVLILFRDSTVATGGIQQKNKLNTFTLADNVKFNLYVNQVLFNEEDVKSVEESWLNAIEAFPLLKRSSWFDTNYNGTKYFVAFDLTSSPYEFAREIESGIKTSAHNNDVALRITLKGVPANHVRADVFLFSSAVVFLDPRGSGDLKLKN